MCVCVLQGYLACDVCCTGYYSYYRRDESSTEAGQSSRGQLYQHAWSHGYWSCYPSYTGKWLLTSKDQWIERFFLFIFKHVFLSVNLCSLCNMDEKLIISQITSSWSIKVSIAAQKFATSTLQPPPSSPVAQCVARRAPMQQCVWWLVRAPSSS